MGTDNTRCDRFRCEYRRDYITLRRSNSVSTLVVVQH